MDIAIKREAIAIADCARAGVWNVYSPYTLFRVCKLMESNANVSFWDEIAVRVPIAHHCL